MNRLQAGLTNCRKPDKNKGIIGGELKNGKTARDLKELKLSMESKRSPSTHRS